MSEAEWAVIEPLLPVPGWTLGKGGSPGRYCRRDIVDGIRYLTHNGPVWRALPADLPHWRTVYHYVRAWQAGGATRRLHDDLREQVRVLAGRRPSPTAACIDSQSVKGADTVGTSTRGYDAGKKVNGRKRHVVVDTIGLLVVVLVTAASVQDRDGGRLVLDKARMAMPSIVLVWADGGYAGRCVEFARRMLRITLHIVKKPEGQRTFEVLPRRWVVERTLSWLVRCRRLDRDYERLPEHAEAMVRWAMIGLMTRRLAPSPGRRPWQSVKAT
jgi:transposase